MDSLLKGKEKKNPHLSRQHYRIFITMD